MSVRRHVRHAVCLMAVGGLLWLSSSKGLADDVVPAAAVAPKSAARVAPVSLARENPTTTLALRNAALALESPLFAEREAASQRLSEGQASAVPVLLTVAREGNLEAAVRAVGVLEAIYVAADAQNDLTTVDRAEQALDELNRTGRPSLADRADVVLESHYEIRERWAVAAITRLGGKLLYGPATEGHTPWKQPLNVAPAPQPVERPDDSSKDKGELTTVIIGPKWQGGDAGLKEVARLKRLKSVYRIEGSQVTDAGILGLRAAVPGLEVVVRGAAKLGISHGGFFAERGCVISEVKEGEAAANAGLRSHDVIMRFGGHTIESFDMLVDLLHQHKPGDVVDTLILRDDVPLKVRVTLTGWD